MLAGNLNKESFSLRRTFGRMSLWDFGVCKIAVSEKTAGGGRITTGVSSSCCVTPAEGCAFLCVFFVGRLWTTNCSFFRDVNCCWYEVQFALPGWLCRKPACLHGTQICPWALHSLILCSAEPHLKQLIFSLQLSCTAAPSGNGARRRSELRRRCDSCRARPAPSTRGP